MPLLPPTWSHGNPIDIIGDAEADRYTAALGAALRDPGIDAVLAFNCPTAVADRVQAAQAVADIAKGSEKPVLASWLGAATVGPSRQILEDAGLATYETPDQAVRGFMHLVRHARNQRLLMEVPQPVPSVTEPSRSAARALIAARFGTATNGSAPRSRRRSSLATGSRSRGASRGDAGGGRAHRPRDRRTHRAQDPLRRSHAQIGISGGVALGLAPDAVEARSARDADAGSPPTRLRRTSRASPSKR